MKTILLGYLIAALVASCLAHPAVYPKTVLARNAQKPVPDILSWHVHVVYNIYDKVSIKNAMALRAQTIQHFAGYLGADCDDRYDFPRLCMIVDHDWNTTLLGGPFPSGEWSVFVPVGYFNLVVPWFIQHRGEFSVLVHPNTGFEYEDHSDWALWSGQPWPLNFHIFKKWTQTNEFGHHRGDAGNPVCLPSGARCGETADAPAALCCFGSACSCEGPSRNGCSCQ